MELRHVRYFLAVAEEGNFTRAAARVGIGQAAPQIASVLALVAAEQGVSIVPGSMRQLALAGVAYRPIGDAAPVARLALASLRGNRLAIVSNFALIARSAGRVDPD